MSRTFVALLGIVVLGLAIRIVGIDWDDGFDLHPDERHIVMDVVAGRVDISWPPSMSWLDPEESPINPRPRDGDGNVQGYAYGTLPVYIVDVIGKIAEQFTGADWGSEAQAQYIGRGLSILLDSGTIVIVYLIGAVLTGRTAGLLASAIYAFLPIAIQLSHFFTVDTWLTFFLFAGIYTCMRSTCAPTLRNFALAGMWFGLAMASKSAAVPFAGIILLALVLASFGDSTGGHDTISTLSRFTSRGSVALITFLAVFFIGEPFAFIEPQLYLDAFRIQAQIQSGAIDAPFAQQYVNTVPFSYQFNQAIRFGIGPVAILMGIAGTGILAWMVLRRQSAFAAVLGAWMIGYLFVILTPETKFLRYLLPLAPALAVTAGMTIAALVTALASRKKHLIALGLVATMIAFSAAYGSAFSAITSDEHSRVTASFWLQEHLPPGSTTSSELWDDRLPLSVGVGWSSEIRRIDHVTIDHYEDRTTLGDIVYLAPSLGNLPDGQTLADSLRAGDVSGVVERLRSISAAEIEALAPVASARFQASLMTGAAGMTTSPELAGSVNRLSRDIALDGGVLPAHIETLADALVAAWDSSALREIYELLDSVDYYLLASNRVESGILQNPWRYAVQGRLYELLEGEQLGFDRVADFTSSPSLFGYSFPDQDGDESYLNYDHPTVTIYEKRDLVPFERFVQLNGSAALAQSQPTREPETEPLIFDGPVSDLPVVDDARWSEGLTGSSWGAAAVWVLMLLILQATAFPVTRIAFRSFPDRGWGYTRLIGIILPATALWWLSSVGILQFQARWAVASLALFALAVWVWLPPDTRRDLRDRLTRRMFLSAELVFWLTFGIFLLFRMINPDSWHPLWGGEKPMEFAQINAILRSATFPPVDPWYSGGFINYYYYGFYLTAWLIKLTGIPIEFAFNLAQPTFIALLASSVFSAGSAIGHRLSRGKSHPFWSGIVAVILVSFAGNMRAVGQVVTELRVEQQIPFPFDHWVFGPSRAIDFAITEFPYFTGLYADLHPHVVALPITVLCIGIAASLAFDFQRAGFLRTRQSWTRVVVAGCAIGVLYPTNAWDLPVYAALVVVSIIVGTASVSGAARRLRAVLAVAGVIGAIALLIALPFLRHYEVLFGSVETVRSQTSVLDLESHLGGPLLILSVVVPVLATMIGRGRRLLPPIESFLLLVSVLLVRWLSVDLRPSLVPFLDDLTVFVVSAIWLAALLNVARDFRKPDFGLPRGSLLFGMVLGSGVAIAAVVVDRAVLGLYLAIGLSASGFWLLARNTGLRFLASLVAAASFVGAGLEIVYLVDDLDTQAWYRMNTIFKFYNQIWILLGIAAGSTVGALLPLAFRSLAHRHAASSRIGWPFDRRLDWGAVGTVSLAVVLILSSVYPITATTLRLETRFPNRDGGLTLNAYAWMDFGTSRLTDGTIITYDEDRDVIDWFNQEVSGTPVIAEASFGPYRCNSSRISAGTGLPSVLGWQRHQMQQRHPEVLPQREADLRTLYASEDADTKLEIINHYDIQYIVVGNLERTYPVVSPTSNECVPMYRAPQFEGTELESGIATFEQMEGDTLEVDFQSGSTIVYRVVGNG